MMTIVAMVAVIDRVVRNTLASGGSPGSVFISSQAHLQPRFFGWLDIGGLAGIAAGVTIGLIVWFAAAFWRGALVLDDRRTIAVAALIVSALNNSIDRVRFGGVWDYWVFWAFGSQLSFNIADVIITVAITYLFVRSFRHSLF